VLLQLQRFGSKCPSSLLRQTLRDWCLGGIWGGTLVYRAHTSYVSILWVCCVLHHSTSTLLLVESIVTIHPCLSRDRSLIAHAPILSDSRSACSLASLSVSISCARAFPNCWTKLFHSVYLSSLNIYYLSPHLYYSLYIHTYNIIYYVFIYWYHILCTLIFRVCSDYPRLLFGVHFPCPEFRGQPEANVAHSRRLWAICRRLVPEIRQTGSGEIFADLRNSFLRVEFNYDELLHSSNRILRNTILHCVCRICLMFIYFLLCS
jgi:hypothetical protein